MTSILSQLIQFTYNFTQTQAVNQLKVTVSGLTSHVRLQGHGLDTPEERYNKLREVCIVSTHCFALRKNHFSLFSIFPEDGRGLEYNVFKLFSFRDQLRFSLYSLDWPHLSTMQALKSRLIEEVGDFAICTVTHLYITS